MLHLLYILSFIHLFIQGNVSLTSQIESHAGNLQHFKHSTAMVAIKHCKCFVTYHKKCFYALSQSPITVCKNHQKQTNKEASSRLEKGIYQTSPDLLFTPNIWEASIHSDSIAFPYRFANELISWIYSGTLPAGTLTPAVGPNWLPSPLHTPLGPTFQVGG